MGDRTLCPKVRRGPRRGEDGNIGNSTLAAPPSSCPAAAAAAAAAGEYVRR